MEAVRRRLVAAGVVLAVGTISSLPFYRGRTPPPPGAASPIQAAPTAARNFTVPLQIASTGRSDRVALVPEDRSVPAGNPARTSRPGQMFPGDSGHASTPQLPPQHPAAAQHVPPVSAIRRSPDPESPVDESLAAQVPPRTHWIVDGDTLEELARRFLGDRTRWREIREANRDILASDDVLPIGREIRIPPRAAAASRAASRDASRDASTAADHLDGLVRIRWKEPPGE